MMKTSQMLLFNHVMINKSRHIKSSLCQAATFSKDILYVDLLLMINFIYLGSCHVPISDVNRFIALGKLLEVVGLMDQPSNPYQELTELEEKIPIDEKIVE